MGLSLNLEKVADMTLTIDILKNYPGSIAELAEIWIEALGKKEFPEVPVEQVINRLKEHGNEGKLPLTVVVMDHRRPVGMCSLMEKEGIRLDLKPWLGALVVNPLDQKRGIGKMLIEATKQKAQNLGFNQIYLFTFDERLPQYYARFGFRVIGEQEYKGRPAILMEADI
ncbi:MAG: acetyltransferase, family [Chlamydiales bacterium]|jgi:predicted N-acetyltransferase YhbS|nr:acetyltransferase, family [Chlamydiales bacterium]